MSDVNPLPGNRPVVVIRTESTSSDDPSVFEVQVTATQSTAPSTSRTQLQSYRRYTDLLMKVIVSDADPSRYIERTQQERNPMLNLLNSISPGFAQNVIGDGTKIPKQLRNFHERTLKKVKKEAIRISSDSSGTIFLNEWDSCTNVILKFQGNGRGEQSAFFVGCYREKNQPILLDSEDVSGFEEFLRENLCGMGGIDRICAVVHDGSRSALIAKEHLSREKPCLFKLSDTVYAANLLLSDFAQLDFLKEVYDKVTLVHEESRAHAGLWNHIELNCLRCTNDPYAQRHSFIFDDDEYGHPFLSPDPVSLRCRLPQHFGASLNLFTFFMRSRTILQDVVRHPDFYGNLFFVTNKTDSCRRNEYVRIIEDNEFISAIRCTYHVTRYIRDFIRKFDGDQPLISDVYEEVGLLRERLVSMPETSFLTSGRKRDILKIFDARKSGAFFYPPFPGLKMSRPECKLLSNIHYCAYVLTPKQSHTQESLRTPMSAFKKQAAAFGTSQGAVGEARDCFVEKLERQLRIARDEWTKMAASDVSNRLESFRNMPMTWWKTIASSLDIAELQKFALATLCIPTSSRKSERSFSYRLQLSRENRARMTLDTFDMVLFTAWNERLLEENNRRSKQDIVYFHEYPRSPVAEENIDCLLLRGEDEFRHYRDIFAN